jgi:hypothetical protein
MGRSIMEFFDEDRKGILPKDIQIPKVKVDIELLKKEKGIWNKLTFLANAYTDGGALQDLDRWNFLEGLASTGIKIGKRLVTNKEAARYLGTASILLDLVTFGKVLEQAFEPLVYVASEPPFREYAQLMGVLDPWLVQQQPLGHKEKMLKAFFSLPPKQLKKHLGIELINSSEKKEEKEDTKRRKVYRILDIGVTTNGDLTLQKESEVFLLESYDQVFPLGTVPVTSTMYDLYSEKNLTYKDREGKIGTMRVDNFLTEVLLPRAFFVSCDFTKEYLVLDGSSMHMEPLSKLHTDLEIQNLDIENMARVAKKILARGEKHGTALIGDAGVGKTEATKAFIKKMGTDYPVIWLTPDALQSSSHVFLTFSYIASVPRAIVVMDDMDSQERLESKTPAVTTLIQQMANPRNNFYLIATINDPSKIDSTILDRGERFDEVERMERPSGKEMAYLVDFYLAKHGLGITAEEDRQELASCFEGHGFTHVQVSSSFSRAVNYAEDDEVVSLEDLRKAASKVAEFSRNAYMVRRKGKLVEERD